MPQTAVLLPTFVSLTRLERCRTLGVDAGCLRLGAVPQNRVGSLMLSPYWLASRYTYIRNCNVIVTGFWKTVPNHT